MQLKTAERSESAHVPSVADGHVTEGQTDFTSGKTHEEGREP